MIRALAGTWGVYSDVSLRVVNMAGGGGTDGTLFVRDAEPDGYTLLGATSFVVTAPLFRPDLDMGLEKFRPLFNVTSAPLMLLVPKNSQFNTLQEFVAYAKTHPGELKYGSSGTGGDLHIGTELFASKAGVQLTHVPLEGGAEQLALMLGGHLDFNLGSFGTFLPSVKSGDVKCLAVVDTGRHASLPDTPTTIESGVDFLFPTWRGIMAPAGLSDERAAILEEIGKKCLEDAGLIAMIKNLGESPTYIAGQEYKDFVYGMREDVRPVVEAVLAAG
jgi:tripartite-type tricarboxylate transporter receptor subunit TctC